MGNKQIGSVTNTKNCPDVTNMLFSNDEMWLSAKDIVGLSYFYIIMPYVDSTSDGGKVSYSKFKRRFYDLYVNKKDGVLQSQNETTLIKKLNAESSSMFFNQYNSLPYSEKNVIKGRTFTSIQNANLNISTMNNYSPYSESMTPDMLSMLTMLLFFHVMDNSTYHEKLDKEIYDIFSLSEFYDKEWEIFDKHLSDEEKSNFDKSQDEIWYNMNMKIVQDVLDIVKKYDGQDGDLPDISMNIVREILETDFVKNKMIPKVKNVLVSDKVNIFKNGNLYYVNTNIDDKTSESEEFPFSCLHSFYKPIEGFSNITEFFNTGKASGYTTKDEKLALGLGLGLGIPLLIFLICYFSMTKKQSKVISSFFGRRK
jgi:hypothetical protein